MSKEIANEYSSSLADLTVNSKPLINMLTMLAEENIEHAPAIVQVVEKHLAKVKPEVKLPVLYLIDSIVKNVGHAYVSLFTQNIVSTFCSVFEKVDEHTRGQMFKLRQTWNDLFPLKKLYAVDVRVNSMDPAWPITAPTPTSIHFNPRFLSMSPNAVPVPPVTPAQPPVTPQPTQPMTSGVQNSAPETGTGTEAQQALTEAQMREQLLRKQKELLELQQRKLELELLQTKARLEDQQRQLQVKEQQRQVEQNSVPSSSQKVEDVPNRNNSNKSPVDQKKKGMANKSVAQTSVAEEVDKTPKTNVDLKSGRDPRLNRQQGSESGNFNYSGLKNSRSRNYIRRNQESSRSPSPCEFPEPSPNPSLKQMPTTESSSGTALVSKMMGDVDLRHCQTTMGAPAEKLPRLAVFDGLMEKEGKDEESKKLLPPKDSVHGEERSKKTSGDGDVINKDVDLRHISRSPPHGKKRTSLEKGEHPPTKKSKAEMFDVLFGNEDVDLRQLPSMGTVTLPTSTANAVPASGVDPVASVASSATTNSSPSKRDSVPPPPIPPLPLTRAIPAPTVTVSEDEEMVPVNMDENMDRKKKGMEDDMVADRAKLWAKYKEVNPDTYKSPLKPSWKAYEGEDRGNLAGAGDRGGRNFHRGPTRGGPMGPMRGSFGRQGRQGGLRRLPGDTDMRPAGSPSKRLPGLEEEDQLPVLIDEDDEDMLTGPGAELGSNTSSFNINIIVAQADEQLKNGTMSFAQYNTLLKQVIHLNEIQKLREAQRREDEQERDSWDSGGESPIDQWDLMEKRKGDEDLLKRREGESKEEDARARGKDGRPIGMEGGEVPLLGRNFSPAHDKPLLGIHGDIDERIQPPVAALVGGLASSSLDKGRSNLMPEVPHQSSHMHPSIVPGGGTPPWRDESQPSHSGRRWESPGSQWAHHPGPPPFSQSGGVGPKTPGDLLPIRREFPGGAPPTGAGFVGPGPRWAHPPPMGVPFRDDEGVYHHPDRFGGPLPHHAGHGRFRLRELPPPDRAELAAMENDRMKTINIDGVPREIRFYGDTAIIMMRWDDPRELCFQGGSRRVTFDGGPEGIICSFGEGPREVLVSGRPHSIRLGAPTRELCINGRWYECHFGGPPISVDLDDGRRHYVELAGPPPQVRIGTDRRADLVAGKINLIIDARDMVPIFLDAKPQCFEIEGRPHTLRFTHALRYVVINGRQFRVEFGGLPMPIIVRDRKHFIRFSALPRGVIPGYVSIAGMEGGRLPSPLPPPSQGPAMPQTNVPVDEVPRPIPEEIPPEHRRVPFDSAVPEAENISKPPPTAHKFTGHEPAMPMLGSASRGRMQHVGRRIYDDMRHSRRSSPNRSNLPPHLRHGNNESSNNQPFLPNAQQSQNAAANRGTSAMSQGSQLPLELLTSLMPVAVAPASGFSYQVQQDSTTEAAKKESDAGTSEAAAVADASNGGKSLPGLGEINVEALFQRLVATGILPQADNTTTEANKKEDTKASYKADFSPECLKSRNAGVISAIYTGIQCSSCGVRFPPEQTMKYSQHLDWHFRQNRRDRDSARKAQSRKWYYDVSDWIQFEEMEDLEERAQSWFETQGVAESKDDRAGAAGATTGSNATTGAGNEETTIASVPAGEKAEDQHCGVCREGFEQFYNEEKEEWHLRDAVRVDGFTYHPLCYEDYKASLESTMDELNENAETQDEGEDKEKSGDEDAVKEKEEGVEKKDGEEKAVAESMDNEDKKPEVADGEEIAKDSEDKPAEDLPVKIKEEPKDEDEPMKTEGEGETEKMEVEVKIEPGVSNEEESDVAVKEEPMESEENAIDDKQDEEMEAELDSVSKAVDTTLNVVACSIDGNVELEDAPTVGAPVAGRIKINISKPLVPNPPPSSVSTSESQEVSPPGVDEPEGEKDKATANDLSNSKRVDEEEEEPLVSGAPPPPGVGTLRLKPRLVGRKLTELPPVMKGTELSGLCSIM